jgi:hypothetical protein
MSGLFGLRETGAQVETAFWVAKMAANSSLSLTLVLPVELGKLLH